MASATHITIAGQGVRFDVSDLRLPGGMVGKSLHVFDLDEQIHYEFQMSEQPAHAIADLLRKDGIVIARDMPENGAAT